MSEELVDYIACFLRTKKVFIMICSSEHINSIFRLFWASLNDPIFYFCQIKNIELAVADPGEGRPPTLSEGLEPTLNWRVEQTSRRKAKFFPRVVLVTAFLKSSRPCLVPVRRFPSPSRSIRFSDVSETNGRGTPHIFAWTT